MIALKIMFPIIFSLYIGGAYAAAFKKKFGESLMMAYSLQILLLLFSGMVFHNLLVGIGLGGHSLCSDGDVPLNRIGMVW